MKIFEICNGNVVAGAKVGLYKLAGDMVMLINYYRYVKDNNIQCDFINPKGIKER